MRLPSLRMLILIFLTTVTVADCAFIATFADELKKPDVVTDTAQSQLEKDFANAWKAEDIQRSAELLIDLRKDYLSKGQPNKTKELIENLQYMGESEENMLKQAVKLSIRLAKLED